MTELAIAGGESLYYEHEEAGAAGKTFVFVNALTGDTSMWEGAIGPALRDAGYGTLSYNFRGQARTSFGDDTDLTPDLIVADLNRLLDHLAPQRPILVGLSIGGLFAAQAQLAKPRCAGLVLINTLRKPGRRLDWINRTMVELARLGGSRLVMAANLPVVINPDFLTILWDRTFEGGAFAPLDPKDGMFRLMAGSGEADWDLPYEDLDLPVLVMTGEHDRLFRIDADVTELTARLPQATSVRFSDAGHLIPAEQPEAFIRELLTFAEGL